MEAAITFPQRATRGTTPAARRRGATLSVLSASAGDDAVRRFLEFFVTTLRSKNTRAAYAKACFQFLGWCAAGGVSSLDGIEPMVVAAHIERDPG